MSSNNNDPGCFVTSVSYTDIDEHIAQMRGWATDIAQLAPGQYLCDILRVAADPYRYTFIKHNLQVLHRAHNNGCGICFSIPLTHQRHIQHLEVQVNQPVITCVPSGEEVSLITPSDYEAVSICIEETRYQQLLEEFSINPRNHLPLHSTKVLHPSLDQLETLQGAMREIQDFYQTTSQTGSASREPLVAISESTILPLLAQIITNPVNANVRSRPELFQTAVKLMLENLDCPPNIFELSCELGTSPRNLQYLFKQHIGMSPKQFIKLCRLNNARRMLRHAHPQRGKISDIANQLGFWHMGSFAQDFKQLFLKNPSDILSIDTLP